MRPPGILTRAVRLYQAHGVSGVMNRVLRTGRGGSAPALPYQVKLEASFEPRWGMISAELQPGCYTLLDIGCNLGAFTARAASAGLWSLGIDVSEKLIRKAQAIYGTIENCGFMRCRLDLESCDRIPDFDVMLVLSVHHHWHQAYGPAIAADMLRTLVAKTNRVMLFEGASRTARYLHDLPDFIDNDEASIVQYYEAYLRRTVGDLVSEIRLLGKAPCVGEREPYRWMYSVIR